MSKRIEGKSNTSKRFGSLAELSQFLQKAAKEGIFLLPEDLHACQNLNDNIEYIDLSSFNAVIEHDKQDQVIKVGSGIAVSELNNYLLESKQWFPLISADKTLFDVINSGDGGPLEHSTGGIRDLVLGVDVLLADGQVIKCGGKVVKNVTGYDLKRVFIGSYMSMGIPVSAYLRLQALPEVRSTLAWIFSSASEAINAYRKLYQSGLPLACLEIISRQIVSNCLDNSSKAGDVMLVGLIVGHQLEVDEIAEELKRVLESSITIENEKAESLWLYLADSKRDFELAIAASLTQTEWILDIFASKNVLFQIRPAACRLKLYLEDKEAVEATVSHLMQMTKQNGEGLVVSFADETLAKRVVSMPENDSAARLKAAVKSRFDPVGILNPFVSL